MVLSNEPNNIIDNNCISDSENNNIEKYVPIKEGNITHECCQNVEKSINIMEIDNDKDHLEIPKDLDLKYEECIEKSIIIEAFNSVTDSLDDDIKETHIEVVASTSSDSNIESLDESENEFVDNSKYGNIVIMEFLCKTKELLSMNFDPDNWEDLMDDVFENSNFHGVCSTEVPLRSIESLPSTCKNEEKKYGGPKMVAFHVVKPEMIPELLKVNKLNVSKVWEFEVEDNTFLFTPEEEFPVICRLPDPVARNYTDLPMEIWGDSVNKDEKEIVKFNNNQLLKETRLLTISDHTAENHNPHQYFLGICNECSIYPSGDIELSRCGGCQLVAYCSRDCQKKNWKKHRDICKKLPIKKGRNVFARGRNVSHDMESWRNFIFDLDDRARKAWETKSQEERYPDELIYWGRYCNSCCESQTEKLYDCACGCVSYCSKAHRNVDFEHFEFCNSLYLCTQVYRFCKLYPGKVYLPYCKEVDEVFNPLTCMSDFMKMCRSQIEEEEWLHVKLSLLSERLSYPLTVIYVLQKVGVGPEKKSVGEITSLNLHLLSHHAMLDASVWEMVLHVLPSLKQLNISYIGEHYIASRMVNSLNLTCTKLKRCNDCDSKDRTISFEVFPMHYHMYFSSEHYSEPDAIGVFQMCSIIETEEKEENVHATTSFRNLTYNKHVPLILTDMQEEFLSDSKKKILKARQVDIVMPAEHNPFAGFRSGRRHKCGFGNPIVNDAEYVACLIRK